MAEAEDYFRKAYEHQMAGRLEKAIENYLMSIAIRPTAEAHTFLGWAYSSLGAYERAIEECARAIEVDPEFGNPYNDIGAYLIELGRPDEAIGWLEKAIRATRYDPRHFPHFNLSRIYEQRYELERAIEHLKKAVELEPHYAIARRRLRKLLARLN